MLHKWEYSDGTVVRWTSKGSIVVSGETNLANNLREMLELRTTVDVFPSFSMEVPFDRSSVWLVDLWLHNIVINRWAWGPCPFDYSVREPGVLVSSTYTPRDEDIPHHVVEIIAQCEREAQEEQNELDEHGRDKDGILTFH